MSNVGTLIHTARTQQGRTLAEVAATVGHTVQYISQIEHGTNRGSPDVLRALARVLGLDDLQVYTAYLADVQARVECQWFSKPELLNTRVRVNTNG